MSSRSKVLEPLYWAIRISLFLLIAFELGLVATGTIADLMGGPGPWSVSPVTWIIIGVSIGLFIVYRIKGPERFETTALATIVLIANLIALMIAEPGSDGLLQVLAMIAIPIAITALVEYHYKRPTETDPSADDPAADPDLPTQDKQSE